MGALRGSGNQAGQPITKTGGGGFVSVMTQSHVHFTDAGVGGNCPEKIRDMAKVTQQGQGLARDE